MSTYTYKQLEIINRAFRIMSESSKETFYQDFTANVDVFDIIRSDADKLVEYAGIVARYGNVVRSILVGHMHVDYSKYQLRKFWNYLVSKFAFNPPELIKTPAKLDGYTGDTEAFYEEDIDKLNSAAAKLTYKTLIGKDGIAYVFTIRTEETALIRRITIKTAKHSMVVLISDSKLAYLSSLNYRPTQLWNGLDINGICQVMFGGAVAKVSDGITQIDFIDILKI